MNNSFIASMNSHIHWARAGLDANATDLCIGELVNLNGVVYKAFEEEQQTVTQLQSIIRCDTLPIIMGKVDSLVLLFGSMLKMILNHPPKNSKLFIYIKCEKEADIIDLSIPEGFCNYTICFYTNSNTGSDWGIINKDTLALCLQLATENKIDLAYNSISGTGCLFILNLPGKLN